MTKTITVNNGEYLSDVLPIVLKYAIRIGPEYPRSRMLGLTDRINLVQLTK